MEVGYWRDPGTWHAWVRWKEDRKM